MQLTIQVNELQKVPDKINSRLKDRERKNGMKICKRLESKRELRIGVVKELTAACSDYTNPRFLLLMIYQITS